MGQYVNILHKLIYIGRFYITKQISANFNLQLSHIDLRTTDFLEQLNIFRKASLE